MALLERLSGQSGDKIAIHAFTGLLEEWRYGRATRTNVVNQFNLSTEDQNDLDWLKGKYDGSTNQDQWIRAFKNYLYMSEVEVMGLHIRTNFVTAINGLP
jgi:hypothetical protein